MKKIIFTVLVLCVAFTCAQASFLEGFGVAARGGGVLMSINTDTIQKDFEQSYPKGWTPGSSETGQDGSGNYGFDVFYEKAGMFGLGSKNMFGVKIGYTKHSDVNFFCSMRSYDINSPSPFPTTYDEDSIHIQTEAYSIPINIYYTYVANRKWKFSGGVGIAFLTNKISGYRQTTTYSQKLVYDPQWGGNVYEYFPVSDTVYGKGSKTDTAIMPTVNVGAEYMLFTFAGLYTDFGYNFNGKTEFNGLEQDFSGFSFTIGLKIHLP